MIILENLGEINKGDGILENMGDIKKGMIHLENMGEINNREQGDNSSG